MGGGQSRERPCRGQQLMKRTALVVLGSLVVGGVQARPVTMFVGAAHTPNVLYGPADMLCDLNTCRLFSLPKGNGLSSEAIVEFGLPQLNGQDRVDIRRCFQICRASVLGFETRPKVPPEHANPTVVITPIELHLE